MPRAIFLTLWVLYSFDTGHRRAHPNFWRVGGAPRGCVLTQFVVVSCEAVLPARLSRALPPFLTKRHRKAMRQALHQDKLAIGVTCIEATFEILQQRTTTMAALLCQSLCKLLSGCTSYLSRPCEACCSCTGKMLCSPFTPYLTVTLAFNIPLVLWGLRHSRLLLVTRHGGSW